MNRMMDQAENVGLYSVPQNKGPSCFFEIVKFKMADWALRLYETYIGLYLCTGLRYWPQFFFVFSQKSPPKRWGHRQLPKMAESCRKRQKIAENGRKLPKTDGKAILVHYFVLDCDIDLIFCISFWVCEIQDGRLSTMFIRNLYWSISLYWVEILTSIFFCFFPEVTPKKVRILAIAENGRKLPNTAENCIKRPEIGKNSWKKLYKSITLYWLCYWPHTLYLCLCPTYICFRLFHPSICPSPFLSATITDEPLIGISWK